MAATMRKVRVMCAVVGVLLPASQSAWAVERVTKAEAEYCYQCGCKDIPYTNSFENPGDLHFASPASNVDDPVYPSTLKSEEITGDEDIKLSITGDALDRINCKMPGRLSRLTGFYLTENGKYVKIYATYKTDQMDAGDDPIVLPAIQRIGTGDVWRQFQYFFDFTKFDVDEADEKLTMLEIHVVPPHAGSIPVYMDEFEICTYRDGTLPERAPMFERIVVTGAGNTLKALDGSANHHSVSIPEAVNEVDLEMWFPAALDGQTLVTVTVNGDEQTVGDPVDASQPVVTTGIAVGEMVPTHVYVTVSLDDDDCDFRTYKIKLDHIYPLVLTSLIVEPEAGNPTFLTGEFQPRTLNQTVLVDVGTPEVTFTPYASLPGATITINGAPVNDGGTSDNITVDPQDPVDIVLNDEDGRTTTYHITLTNLWVSFDAATPVSGPESETNPAIAVTLSQAPADVVSVEYYINQANTSATAPDDYTLGDDPGTLTFGAGEQTKVIPDFSVVDDDDAEDPETVEFALRSPEGAVVRGRGTHSYTIADPIIAFEFASSGGPESKTDPLIAVTISRPHEFDVTVDYTVTGGTATPLDDYTVDPDPGTLTFPAGETETQYIDFIVEDDSDFNEGDETIEITLSTPPTGGAEIGEPSVHVYTIEDDDPGVIFVDQNAVGSGDDGSSWADAYLNLQNALDDADAATRQIWVADGTYEPSVRHPTDQTDDSYKTFLLEEGRHIVGGFTGYGEGEELSVEDRVFEEDSYPGFPIPAHRTVLSGDIGSTPGDFDDGDVYSVVTAEGDAYIDGFEITGGYSSGGSADYWERESCGGALFAYGHSVCISNCLFSRNVAYYGGAVMCNGSNDFPAGFNDCVFNSPQLSEHSECAVLNVEGRIMVQSCLFDGEGQQLNIAPHDAEVLDCVFKNNLSRPALSISMQPGLGLRVLRCVFLDNGSAISNPASNLDVVSCTFIRNEPDGAIHNDGLAVGDLLEDVSIDNCVFADNVATGGIRGRPPSGGAIANELAKASVTNCTFHNNTAGHGRGGAVWSYFTEGALEPGETGLTVRNCLLWENTASMDQSDDTYEDQIWLEPAGAGDVKYSCVQSDTYPSDPLGGDPTNLNKGYPVSPFSPFETDTWFLRSGSTCIDAGDNTSVDSDVDRAGHSRKVDDPEVDDTGNGVPPIVDIGCYEKQ